MSESRRQRLGFYRRIKRPSTFSQILFARLLSQVDQSKVERIGNSLSSYLRVNLPETINRRRGLSDYKTNPYVLLTSASSMSWSDIEEYAAFLFNSKLYAGLETSFGKTIESEFLQFYPREDSHWETPLEKVREADEMSRLPPEDRARARDISVWREIDKSFVDNNRRYLLMIKSGPHCINDTQVEAMKNAIATHFNTWDDQTRSNYSQVDGLDIVIGLTYGTEKTTNNKENQILIKLLEHNFIDSGDPRGTLFNRDIKEVRVYRVVGRDFWALVGNPGNPDGSQHVFIEVLLGLLEGLKQGETAASLETLVNRKIQRLSQAIQSLALPEGSIPQWMSEQYDENELLWFMSALTTFFDQGMGVQSRTAQSRLP